MNSWEDVARLLALFAAASAASVHRLRLCFESESPLPHEHDAVPDFDDTSPEQLEGALLDAASPSAFRTLRAVDFACYLDGADEETLCAQRGLLVAWVARTFVRLCERCAAEVYTYKYVPL